MDTPEILVIEGDEQIRKLLATMLAAEGYRVREASTAAAGVLLATRKFCDLIVLDASLPDGDGIQVIRRLREAGEAVPIIVLSTCSNEQDKILALDSGADDFVNTAVSMGELRARVRVAIRRSAHANRAPVSIYRTGEIEVDLNTRQVTMAGCEVHLTRIEFRLLEILIRHADQNVSHERLLRDVWGTDHAERTNYLRIYMLQLRRKLEISPSNPRYLLTVPGVGYRLATQHFPDSWRELNLYPASASR